MNCHGNHGNNGNKGNGNGHGSGHKSHMSHMLLMVLCCALPVVLLLLFPLLKINSTALKSILPFVIFLLCPLMHILMIPLMFRKDKNKGGHQDNYQTGRIEARKEEA